MEWELAATWVGLGITAAGGIFAVGKKSQQIEDLQGQIDDFNKELQDTRALPIKLATLETDMKYLIQSIAEIKSFLIKDLAGGK